MGLHELEIKRLLAGEDAAKRFLAALAVPVTSSRRQVNNVFDTAGGHLARSRYTLRLRTEDGGASLTAKGPGRAIGVTTASRMEAEAAIEDELVEDLLAGAIEPLCVLRERVPDGAYGELWRGIDEARGCRPLRATGRFENLRRVVAVTLPGGLELTVELDRTVFPGGRSDHEVEIELPDEALVEEVEAWLEDVTRAAGIRTRASSPKLARYYEALALSE